ncbi:MAG TPA: winged helix-turn-helix domain-containing protein [Candidatus Nitrosotalea sp.]|nr:winged helix-turn-helix domain-containing protein [Candidatus Nitrosotalea sp.]
MMVEISKTRAKNSRSYNIDIMQRIFDAVYEMGNSKLTKIAVHAGLNNQMCKRYLHFMNTLGWIRVNQDGKNGFVLSLTETGLDARIRLQKISDMNILE